MSRQIIIKLASSSKSEIVTPPAGYGSLFINENGIPTVLDDQGNEIPFTAGVAQVNEKIGIVELKSFSITQWRRDVGTIAIPDGGTYNIFEGFLPGDKLPVSATDAGALNITNDAGQDFIQTNWRNTKEFLQIRVLMQLQQGGVDYYRLQLRRKADDSIISVHPFSINAGDQPEEIASLNILTYVGSNTDSFVTGGFYILLLNDSGGAVDLVNNLDILINRSYQLSL